MQTCIMLKRVFVTSPISFLPWNVVTVFLGLQGRWVSLYNALHLYEVIAVVMFSGYMNLCTFYSSEGLE